MNKLNKLFIWINILFLIVNLFFLIKNSGIAEIEGGSAPIGRFQIATWQLPPGQESFNKEGYYGYYILDTTTGKIIEKDIERP